ncbi:DEAD/DEAH box helicase [Rhodococcus qingshengii]|uniref:DEAD/DEAH box helicase n=1 Tax=Rhodococcus qingshengii TaxID=334542 RepID=UPI00311CC76F
MASELLPLSQAERITASLLDYLGTTFALADPDARRELDAFLEHPSTGMFRGPYLRLRMPFRPAEDGWRDSLEWYEGFTPYGHQAAAFARLSSANLGPDKSRPLPTLVTTGTGSGKTEAFLYPILDHVLRAKRQGVTGTKAIILYPMNALANDQAQRLAGLITEHKELGGITAALYTGEAGATRTTVGPDGLISDRDVIRSVAPDILLTNYKMLDQLLLRPADAELWRQSAHSLQYLVLDEFHTYDGAQGTDVSMLLRRLGMTLKSYWVDGDTGISDEDRARPLGRVTPIATSATLGDGNDSSTMLDFARTVFGDEFTAESVVTESRESLQEWSDGAASRIADAGITVAQIDEKRLRELASASSATDPVAVARAAFRSLYTVPNGFEEDEIDGLSLDLIRAHPVFHRIVERCESAVPILDLPDPALFAGTDESLASALARIDPNIRAQALRALVTTLSHVRAVSGRTAPSVDVHLWVRELTRLDRAASGAPQFAWGDDGLLLSDDFHDDSLAAPYLPALYCRHCNRSGWGILLAPTGTDLDVDDSTIRRRKLADDDRFRALIHAPVEGETAVDSTSDSSAPSKPASASELSWLVVDDRRITRQRPAESVVAEGGAVPVLVNVGDTAGEDSIRDVCPSCRQRDGIRFLGSAIATMLSVSLSTLFGTPGLDPREKRALVFTDSVQDAAHRAGFVQARSRALTLRTLIRQALEDGDTNLDALAHKMITMAGNDRAKRYRLLPPELADRDDFSKFWSTARLSRASATLSGFVTKRLQLDIAMEFGLRAGVGRTLTRTGTALAEVDVSPSVLLLCARDVLDGQDVQLALDTYTDAQLVRWVRGTLEHMRIRGAIAHDWFEKFRTDDGNRWWITGGRKRSQGMPGFGRGNSAPGFPVLGTVNRRDSDFEPVASARGWYASWTAKALAVSPAEGAVLSRLLFERLRHRDVVGELAGGSGTRTFHLTPDSVVARPISDSEISDKTVSLGCSNCGDSIISGHDTVDQLVGGPCLIAACAGTLERRRIDDNFYRQMYTVTDIRRVVAREHTSLLPDEKRLEYESQFKETNPPPNAPNVLVATPTLEMGIDIGDLSAVMLSSLPRSVASYLQRVGRAGRLTGNALALAYVTARGDQLPRFANPDATINGAVRPPATYLDAEEILRRQFIASVADRLARLKNVPHPRTTPDALGSTGPKTYLGTLISDAESHSTLYVDEFVAGFQSLDGEVVERLRDFATPQSEPESSELASRCHSASMEWNQRIETLQHRKKAVDAVVPQLHAAAQSTVATDDDKVAYRTALAAQRLVGTQLASLRSEYWISALEAFGLFPNYTLLDDSVTLSVSVNWIHPETQEFEHTEFELTRGSAQALRDFAPGSTFYASGFAIAIDAVDLGDEGDAVHEWACCPACGFIADLGDGAQPPATCPRCGTAAIADIGQRLPVVELSSVSAVVRREEAAIDDGKEERIRNPFTIITAADIDPTSFTRRWFVEGLGFGATHRRSMTIRWINTGGSRSGGSSRILAGGEIESAMFRVCSECGKLDTDTRRNSPSEHRPWCSYRKALEESTLSIALARSLTTEGLVLRLPPSVTWGDSFAVPSLSAALLLGLRERIGGDPDHLQIVAVVDPAVNGENRPGLLLHDIVPGGTGYLADLSDPSTIWDVLRRAHAVVVSCECQHEGKLACEKCLLPFASFTEVKFTSRSAAARHLRSLLLGREVSTDDNSPIPDAMPWSITSDEPPMVDLESNLERRFRVVFAERLRALGATIVEKPTDRGVAWDVALGSSNRWSLRPQENILGSKPDFVLTSATPGVPPTAIFTDGWQFHASPSKNRLADDAEKRRNLRDGGYQVVAVTHQDLEGKPSTSPILAAERVPGLLQMAGDQLAKSSVDLVFATAIDLLLAWMQSPQTQSRRNLAHWLPVLAIMGMSASATQTGGAAPAVLAGRLIDGGVVADPNGDTITWRDRGFAIAVRVPAGKSPNDAEVAVVIDDDDSALSTETRDLWREWLRWSNLLELRPLPAVVTTRRHLASSSMNLGSPASTVTGGPSESVTLTGPWREVYDEVVQAAQSLVTGLAASDLPIPEVGEEVAGVPLEISWPSLRIAVDLGLDAEDREGLTAAGWTLCPVDAKKVIELVQAEGLAQTPSVTIDSVKGE